MIRAIIFDLDETLIDRDSTMRAFLATQQTRFPELPGDFIEECIKFQHNGYADKLDAYQQACAAIGVNDPALPLALFTDLRERYGFEPVVFEGAKKILHKLSSVYPLGLITNGRTRGQMAKIANAGLRAFFLAIVISEAHGMKKPHPSIFEACLEQLNVRPQEAVYIGDSPANDIAPAKALGMRAIWMRNDNYTPPKSCDAIAGNIQEVPVIIAGITADRQ